MKIVVDKLNREWTISINVNSLARIRAATGLNLYDISPGPDGLATVQRVLTDGLTFGTVLGALLGPQMKSQGLDEEQFFATVGAAELEQMQRAFIEEWSDFFQSSSQATRQAVARIIRDLNSVLVRLQGKVQDKLRETPLPEIDPDQIADSIWSRRSSSWPESSASTPAPSPGVN